MAQQKDDLRYLSVRLPAELHSRLRILAIQRDTSTQALVTGWIEREVRRATS